MQAHREIFPTVRRSRPEKTAGSGKILAGVVGVDMMLIMSRGQQE